MKKNRLKYAIIGFIGVCILAFSYWGLNYLKGTSLFRGTNTYYVYYERVDGLNTSDPVTVMGFKVGQVDKIKLSEIDFRKIKVTISVSDDIKIPQNSTARIYSMDLMGSKGIELIFSDEEKYHESYDFLKSDIEKSLKEEVNYQMLPLKNQAEELMAEIQTALEVVSYIFSPETQENLGKSIESLKNTLSHLESSAESLDSLIIDQSTRLTRILRNVDKITSNLSESNEKITNILENLSAISDTVASADISKTLADANEAVEKFNSVMDKIDRGEGTLGALVNDDRLYTELDNAAKSLDELLKDIQQNPRRYVNFSFMNIGRTINVGSEEELKRRDRRALEEQ